MPKQVRTLSVYRNLIEQLPEFRLISPVLNDALIRRIGFDANAAEGHSIVPRPVGKATWFNANGKEIVRKDLPMETRSRMIHTSWEDWHGQTHSGVQTREYEAYPREMIPPPGEVLTLMRLDGQLIAASRLIHRDEQEADIAAVINVFLELFATFRIVKPDLAAAVQVRKLNWKILPQGRYPFDRARHELDEYLQRLPEDERETALHRIHGITRHTPDFIAIGIGGFEDYVVFGFTNRRRYVLESPNTGNATYVFRNDWEHLSNLSKREILQSNLQEARLIHNSRWHIEVGRAIAAP